MGGAAVVKRGFDLPRLVVDVAVAPKVALPRQCIAIPAVDDESEVLLTADFAFLDRFVATACITRGTAFVLSMSLHRSKHIQCCQ